jgi:VRR-NUC domain
VPAGYGIPLEDILERDWQRDVRKMLTGLGWRLYHTYDSRKSDTGFPDLVAVSPSRRRIVYLELKREKTKLTGDQARWILDLLAAGGEVYVARPRNLQALTRVLSGAAKPADMAEATGELLLERDASLASHIA